MRLSKRRLAGIRRPRDRDHQPVAQPLAARGAGQRCCNLAAASSRSNVERRRRPDPPAHRPRRRNRSAPRPAPAPRSAACASASARSPSRPLSCRIRLAPLRLGLGVDQVGQALDRGEVELAVLERAAGELARLRRPQALDARRAPRAPRRSPRGRRAAAARRRPRRSRCAAPETTAPAPRRSPRRSPDRARAPAPPCAAPALGRSAPRARRRRAARRCAPPRSPPAAGRRRGRRWCRAPMSHSDPSSLNRRGAKSPVPKHPDRSVCLGSARFCVAPSDVMLRIDRRDGSRHAATRAEFAGVTRSRHHKRKAASWPNKTSALQPATHGSSRQR